MLIGNATGCSSIWGGSAPAIPYCVDKDGFGPTWGNSLFEDSAEFTYGMFLGAFQQRNKLADLMREALETDIPQEIKDAMQGWLDNFKDADGSRKYGDQLKAMLSQQNGNKLLAEISEYARLFTKKSYWVFAGDGAAYDIAYGGIDHILASGEDILITGFGKLCVRNKAQRMGRNPATGESLPLAARRVVTFRCSGKLRDRINCKSQKPTGQSVLSDGGALGGLLKQFFSTDFA